MTETRRQKWTGVLLLTVLTLTLSLWGGTPFQQLDSIVLRAHKVMATGGDPEFFHYPALVIYLTAIPYSILHWIMGDEAARELMRVSTRSFEAPFFSYFFLGHLVSALFGLLGVLSIRSAARTLFQDSQVALAAGAFLATALLWVTDSHLVTVDVPLAALLALTLERTVRVVCRASAATLKETVVIGLCAGLATSAKYNGALILLPVTLALAVHSRAHGGKLLQALFVPGAAAVAIFLLTNPFVLIEFEAFRSELMFEWKHSKMGHAGYMTENGYAYHFFESLVSGFGWPGLVAAGIGFWLVLRSSSISTAAKIAVIGFPLVHFLLIGNSKLAFARYMLPMLPFLALAAGGVIHRLRSKEGRLGIASAAIALVVIAPGLVWSVKHNVLMSKPDIRRELVLALQKADLDLFDEPVYAIGQAGVCARWGGLPFKKGTRIDTPIASARPTQLYLFDSFVQDRVLYDEPEPEIAKFYPGDENVLAFDEMPHFRGMTALQFSPFTVPKSEAPLSRKSIYSPSLPDLRVRRRSGPFLELWFREEAEAIRLQEACRELSIEVTRKPASEAYYFTRLSELARKRKQAQ